MSLRRVIVESPYAAKTPADIDANIRYARAAVRDSVLRDALGATTARHPAFQEGTSDGCPLAGDK